MEAALPKLEGRIKLYQDSGERPMKLLAFGELVIGGSFVIKGIRVLQRREPGEDEPFISFPAERGRGEAQDRWFDVAHPVTAEARQAASSVLLERYRELSQTTRDDGETIPKLRAARRGSPQEQ